MKKLILTEDNLRRLRNSLPHCYAEKLQERLYKKGERFYALNSIRRHLTMEYVNETTVNEALLLAKETKEKRIRDLAKRKKK